MTKIAVVYYSATGNIAAMANAIGEGAASVGAEVRVRRVAETAPAVLPWKALVNDTTFLRPVWKEANFSAFSFDSAPEFVKNNW